MRAPQLEAAEKFYFLRESHKFETGLTPAHEKELAKRLVHAFPPSLKLLECASPNRLHDVVPIVLESLLNFRCKAGTLLATARRPRSLSRSRSPLSVKNPIAKRPPSRSAVPKLAKHARK
tara:strand:- start:185 stop:544 length:360 start_codon:yes stop_codon:yes gene_type:complete